MLGCAQPVPLKHAVVLQACRQVAGRLCSSDSVCRGQNDLAIQASSGMTCR